MKIKNLLAFVALSLGLAASPFAARGAVSGGDIYSVDLTTDMGGVIPGPDSALTIGERVTVRLRLVNKTRTSGDMQTAWRFVPAWPSGEPSPEDSVFGPKLGLMLGGQQVFADYMGARQVSVGSPAKNNFTDLFFQYTVKSGDLALPARFMSVGGKAVSDENDDTDYAIQYSNYLGAYWKLSNDNGNDCILHFCNENLSPDPDQTWEAGKPQRFITGTELGIRVKTVDFDTEYFREPSTPGGADGVWRQFYVGLSTALPFLPTVKVDGAADVSATMYVWIENADITDPVAEFLTSDKPEKVTDVNPYTKAVTYRWVLKVPIAKGATAATFRLQGVREGTTIVRMSASRELSYNKAGNVIADWVERPISVVPAPEPFVMVETLNRSGEAQTEFNCTENYQDYVGMFRVSLSLPPTDKVTVTLTPDWADVIPADAAKRRIGLSLSGEKADLPWLDRDGITGTTGKSIEFAAGESVKTLYIYALDRTTDHKGKIAFAPVLSGPGAAMYTGQSNSGSLVVNAATPAITAPASGEELDTAVLKDDYTLFFEVTDGYRCMNTNSGWKVEYKCSALGDTKSHTVSGTIEEGTQTLTADIKFTQKCTHEKFQARVKDPNGVYSAWRTYYITVEEGRSVKVTYNRDDSYAESSEATAEITFELSQTSGDDLYIFLEPVNEAASNHVTTAQIAKEGNRNGIEVPAGETLGRGKATISLLDGGYGSNYNPKFRIVVCNQDSYSEDAEQAGWAGSCTISVTNVVPKIRAVEVGGSTVNVNGGKSEPVAQEVNKTFKVVVDEPGQLDLSSTNEPFITQWRFGAGAWQEMKGNPNELAITNKFSSSGDQVVTVRCQDKDMRALGKWSEEFTFTVPVLDTPRVVITPTLGRSEYYEDETGSGMSFDVTLTVPPSFTSSTNRLNVLITKERLGDKAKYDDGDLVLSKTNVTFTSNRGDVGKFYLQELDGTTESASKGFRITAKVTNAELDSEGKRWESGEFEVYVVNREPKILTPSERYDSEGKPIATVTTKGADNTLTWSIKDVAPDSTNMVVTWETSEGQRVTYHQGAGTDTLTDKYQSDVMSGTHTFRFESAGEKSITMVVRDKDGGQDTRTFYYTIKASKSLTVVPHGPAGGFGTAQSSRYSSKAKGLGEGRVWANNLATVSDFTSSFNCGVSSIWTVYAYGYKVGDVDNGATLHKIDGTTGYYTDRDTAIDRDGNKLATGKTAYAYDAPRDANGELVDSFLYAWLQVAKQGENGSALVDALFGAAIRPEYPLIAKDSGIPVGLPDTLDEKSNTYPDTILEAIFSREYRAADNMGDINQDGVPDIYVSKYGLGIIDSTTGLVSADDLMNVSASNLDGDFLPSTETSQYASLIPGLSNTWVQTGRPFTAVTEIRGYHEGLNDAPEQDGITGAKSVRVYAVDDGAGNWIYSPTNCTISELEYIAFTNWCARQESPLAPSDKANWEKWSPERPTDPMLADTDEDGMTDGYEYFFWYRAHVGYLDDKGVYTRMTGRRFVATDPANPEIITADEIAELMDPRVPSDKAQIDVRDSDNDGLPDIIEFERGTNPFDFDTDGDGLPDGYEVMITETDPLLYATDKVHADGTLNPDHDFMAVADTALNWVDLASTAEPFVTNRFWSVEPFTFTNVVTGDSGETTNRQVLAHGALVSRWRYGVGDPEAPWALGGAGETTSVTGAVWSVVTNGSETVKALHYQVFERNGFDPRVAWNNPDAAKNGHCITTKPFTHLDEFLVMAFYYRNGGLKDADLGVGLEKWTTYCTSPVSADTDADGMPDGWELYIQKDGGPDNIYSPLHDFNTVSGPARDPDNDGLDFVREYAGIESIGRYSATCETIQLTPDEERWQNKWWPTNPYNADTDDDGIKDGDEQAFIYGALRKGAIDDEGCVEGGGLNPLSWDTDLDGLPDSFELEFKGSGAWTETAGAVTTNVTEGVTNVSQAVSGRWNDLGMNGTVNDARKDYDRDGLANWQEYMTGAMRCWRYDDTVSPWVDGPFDPVAYKYFSLCTNAFEQDAWTSSPQVYNRYYMFKDGWYHDLARTTPNRFTEKEDERVASYSLTYSDGQAIHPQKYICTSPISHDTDQDGMDDYYELFHGLNPLLGGTGSDEGIDIVFSSYAGDRTPWSAENNYWLATGVSKYLTRPETPLRVTKQSTGTSYDFFQYPWLAGLARVDADGDNIRNLSEAIMSLVQATSTFHHSDPTPLWMTDTSYPASLVSRYYYLPADAMIEPATITILQRWMGSRASGTMFSYEENEGFDSDHDFLGDFEETQGKTKSASDPIDHDSPLRRQAMWLNGTDAFLQTALSEYEAQPNMYDVSTVGQNYLYFTVECWAKPDAETLHGDQPQTLVERSIWTGPAGSADEKYLRKNFLIGIRGGRWYAMFDSEGVDAKQQVEITNGPEATTNWTHIAFTYGPESGSESDADEPMCARLYVNGVCSVAKRTAIRPEHGVSALKLSKSNEMEGYSLWQTDLGHLASFTVGASAETQNGICYDISYRTHGMAETTLDDYGRFYRGYIDEVRIWDGARPAKDISDDYTGRVRYTAKTALENRQVFRNRWEQGGTRSPDRSVDLPARLMHHWSFDHLAGAVEAKDVMDVPAGFRTGDDVTDGMAIWARPVGWTNAWWSSVAVRSTVYTDAAWVPWINDTVGHLPRPDRTTLDSVYWSENFAGGQSAEAAGFAQFYFPRTTEVPSRWVQQTYATVSYTQSTRLDTISSDAKLKRDYDFTMLDRQTAGFDLLPMGGAYPRRISAAEGGMWDDNGAADAWAESGIDADHNSLPDWWERYARANYARSLMPWTPFTWDTTVTYHGVEMPAWQAYLRDLARGLLPDGKIHPEYADTRDLDNDGLPDWWAELYGVIGADEDPDNDGLSNYQEYLLSEVYPYAYDLGDSAKVPLLDPTLAYSVVGQRVPDYFLKYSTEAVDVVNAAGEVVFGLNEYFGEIVTDHDFMEDWWENALSDSYVNSRTYDPLDDKDEDGWSNWAECRAALWGGFFTADLIDSWTGVDSSQHIINYPEPIIGVKVTYHGEQDVSGHQLVVRTTTGQTPRTDATFVVPATLDSQVRYIGPFYGTGMLHGHLSPGRINANSIMFDRAEITSDKVYKWNCDWYIENEGIEPKGWGTGRTHVGTYDRYKQEFDKWPKIELEGGDLTWESFVEVLELTPGTATVMLNGATFGTVNCETGEYELDMSKFDGEVSTHVFRVTYTSRIGHEWPQTVYLSDTKELATGDGAGIAGNGHVREGRNMIEAFMDLDGNGVYTAGEPFGSVRNVMVGWHKVPVVTVELKDESFVMPVQAIGSAGEGEAGEGGSSGELTQTIRITRRMVNGQNEKDGHHLTERALLTKKVVLDDHPYISEADVLNVAKPDLDFSWLAKDARKFGIENIESVTYSVDQIVTFDDGTTTNMTLGTFTKEFPLARPAAAAVSPVERTPVYSASPTFIFSSTDERATGYRLQICCTGDNAATNCLYDSGIRLLPGRTGSTVGRPVYEVTPPVFVGMDVYAGISTNRAFIADGANYQWRVALYNAKFSEITDSSDWSAWATFQTDLANQNRYPKLTTGYGNATLAVRYYGADTNALAGSVIVEAFANADFSGQPMAQVRIGGSEDLLRTVEDVTTTNAVLRGLTPGKVFFRAYVDQNDDGIRESWESWGYANMVGKGVKAIYNPVDFTVRAATKDFTVNSTADLTIFIEDCDTNKNEWPDGIDPYGDFRKETPYWIEPETTSGLSEDPLADTDGDGMPDNWETWTDGIVDPLVADGDFAPEANDDVMAYLEEERLMVTIDDGSSEGLRLLLADGETYVKGDNRKANAYRYSTWYLYGPLGEKGQIYGLGTNVAVTADWDILSAEPVKVALVHAQVYSKKGFNTLTANPQAYADDQAVDTKPFTALDRYLVMRYFEAIGAAPAYPSKYKSFEEYALNAGSGVWANWALLPGLADSNFDKIDDGWQLYVMYGPELAAGASASGLALATSPWGAAGATRVVSPDGDGLSWSQEYDAGHCPTDPWCVDTDKDGVLDVYAYRYHLKGDDAGEDFDGDGLSNYAEYLISEVFGYAELDPEDPKTNGYCVDYFRKVGDLYLGEIFTDHDQVDDLWEASFPGKANRYVYDPSRDDDGDGWSNWAEAKAGTSPASEYEVGIDDYTLANYPVPCVEAFLACAEGVDPAATVVIRAWSQKSDPDMTGPADAEWVLGGGSAETDEKGSGEEETSGRTYSKYLGIKPVGVQSYNLGSGSIRPGSVRICFKDLSFSTVRLNEFLEIDPMSAKIGNPTDALWYYMTIDRMTSDGKGALYTAGGIAADEQKVGTIDYETGRITVDFNGKYMTGLMLGDPSTVVGANGGDNKGAKDDGSYDLLNLDESYALITWESNKSVGALNRPIRLSDAMTGHLREGLNTFVCYVGDSSGEFVPGEPFGIVRDVDVGWDGAKLEARLTGTSAITPRVDLWEGTSDRAVNVDEQTYSEIDMRGLMGETNAIAGLNLNPVLPTANSARIRVVRYMVDGFFTYSVGVPNRTVLDRYFDKNDRTTLSEADFLSAGAFDIDWEFMSSEVCDHLPAHNYGVTNVSYLIVLGDGPSGFTRNDQTNEYERVTVLAAGDEGANQGGTSSGSSESEMKPLLVTRRFERNRSTPKAIGLADGNILHSSRPTFVWSMPDEEPYAKRFGSSYVAFRIQVLDKDANKLVWTSDVMRAPAQNADGNFVWTAPLYVGDQLANVMPVFKSAGNYQWRVAMYNAKFPPAEKIAGDVWSEIAEFSVAAGTQQETDDRGYSSVEVNVKYTGPEKVLEKCEDLKTAEGVVRIQAFSTADFCGEPVAQGFVTNKAALVDTTDLRANGRLVGLTEGTYYIRAYIDSNGNFKKDDWESWGAAKEAVVVKANQLAPVVGLYIEDADTDQDWIPDAYEWAKNGDLNTENAYVDPNGEIVLKTATYDALTDGTANFSRFLSGATVELFQNLDAAKMLLKLGGDTTTDTIAAIRRAIEKKIVDDTLQITSLVLDPDNGQVKLTVAGKVADSIAGQVFSPMYELKTDTVKVRVYGKTSLADAGWTKLGDFTSDPIDTTYEQTIAIPLTGLDLTSGFFKVEVVQ